MRATRDATCLPRPAPTLTQTLPYTQLAGQLVEWNPQGSSAAHTAAVERGTTLSNFYKEQKQLQSPRLGLGLELGFGLGLGIALGAGGMGDRVRVRVAGWRLVAREPTPKPQPGMCLSSGLWSPSAAGCVKHAAES